MATQSFVKNYVTFCLCSLLLVLAMEFAGCSKDDAAVQLRIENQSTYTFSAIEVQWSQPKIEFGNLAAGQKSAYQEVQGAYRYGYIKLLIGSDEFVLQPIDYVGETQLEPGAYTYALDVTDYDNRRLQLTLVKD